jgi:uncharacterized OsmC-like protein
MEVLVEYENGFRFSATCKGYTVTTGRGEDGNEERDGMWPAQLFEASIGMCIGGYIVKYCKECGIPCEDMTIELSRRIQSNSANTATSGAKLSRTTRIDAKIHVGAKLSPQQQQGVLEAADYCHITNSIRAGMQIVCSLAGT